MKKDARARAVLILALALAGQPEPAPVKQVPAHRHSSHPARQAAPQRAIRWAQPAPFQYRQPPVWAMPAAMPMRQAAYCPPGGT